MIGMRFLFLNRDEAGEDGEDADQGGGRGVGGESENQPDGGAYNRTHFFRSGMLTKSTRPSR